MRIPSGLRHCTVPCCSVEINTSPGAKVNCCATAVAPEPGSIKNKAVITILHSASPRRASRRPLLIFMSAPSFQGVLANLVEKTIWIADQDGARKHSRVARWIGRPPRAPLQRLLLLDAGAAPGAAQCLRMALESAGHAAVAPRCLPHLPGLGAPWPGAPRDRGETKGQEASLTGAC